MTIHNVKSDLSALACPLSQVRPVSEFGGKAYHLSRMLDEGLPVFPGFVVTNHAFQAFLDVNQLRDPIASIVDQIDVANPASLQQASRTIRELVQNSALPERLADDLHRQWNALLPGKTLIVRSSAVGEDSQQASFAGQLDSILNVTTQVELVAALLACWASYWSDRSLFYQRGRGISLDGMGVLIQEQATSAVSGVLFTVSPDVGASGAADRMAVEFCPGFGSALVSGEINPGRLSVDRGDFSQTDFETSGDRNADGLMSHQLITSLAGWGLKLEELFSGAQDIEWTVDAEGRLYLLQSRGITVLPPPAGRTVLWSNANVNENFPEPICPLLYSVASTGYDHYFRNLGVAIGISADRIQTMDGPLRRIIGVHGARMYYNLTNIHACLRMAPRGERLTELFNNFVGADRIADEDNPPNWQKSGRVRIRQFFEVLRIAITVGWRALRLQHGVREFETTVDQFADETQQTLLQDRSLAELLTCFRRFIDIRSHRWVKASLADAAAMLSYGLLKSSLHEEFPDDDLAALHNTLLKGLPNLASNKPVIGLWELSRQIQNDPQLRQLFHQHGEIEVWNAVRTQSEFSEFYASVREYLDDSGFRCSGELMLTVASFQENPAALVEILKAYSALEGESPAERLHEQESQRITETDRMLKTLSQRWWFRFLPWPRKSLKVGWLLKWAQHSIALRERARLKQALLYSRLRRIVLQIGERLVTDGVLREQQDVFFLTHGEIDDLLSGGSMFPHDVAELISVRKSGHQRMSQLNPPDTFELPEGESYRSSEQPPVDVEPSDIDVSPHLAGVGACGGTVTANAAVLQDVSEFSRLSQGDILVTRQTDPGWGPLFFLIRGLVIERGGMLSHGAILAREYGIPTVVGVPQATQKITHGQTLTVNGDRGTVRLSDE